MHSFRCVCISTIYFRIFCLFIFFVVVFSIVYKPVICFHDEGGPLAGGLGLLVVDVHLRDRVEVNAPLRLPLVVGQNVNKLRKHQLYVALCSRGEGSV